MAVAHTTFVLSTKGKFLMNVHPSFLQQLKHRKQLHVVLFQWHVPKTQPNVPKAHRLLPLRQMSQSFNEMIEQLALMLTVLRQRQFHYPQMHFRHIKNRAHCLPLFMKFIYRQVPVFRNKMPNRIRGSPLPLCHLHLKRLDTSRF